MKNIKLAIGMIAVVILIAMISTGCTANDPANEENIDNKIGIISEEIDVSDIVLEAAKEKVQKDFDLATEEFPDYEYTNWRIQSLEYNYTYEDLDGMKLVLYQLNYEFHSQSPENVVMAGGMTIQEDNWVMPSYPNSNYLIFQEENDELSFLESVMINDATPGTELFTDDLLRLLNQTKND